MNEITHATFTSLNTDVRMLGDLYSLNDLHRAAGGQEKHSPRHWSRLQQTKDLIAEIEKEQICAIQSKQGLGTFVCKELVCDYAAWIDAAFHLKIIRTFLASSTNQDRLSTKADRVPLKDAVNLLVAKTNNLNYSEAYRLVHQHMGIGSVEELTISQLPTAVEYVHGLVIQVTAIQGELMPRAERALSGSPFDMLADGRYELNIKGKDITVKDISQMPANIAHIDFDLSENADYQVIVRNGKAKRQRLLYILFPEDKQQPWAMAN